MTFTMKRKDPLIDRVKKIYIITFVLYLMLSRMVLFVNLITMNVNSIIYNLLAVCGCIILLWDFVLNIYELKSIENIILFVFLIVCVISTILNISYGYVDNLKTIAWTAIQFYILFSSLHINNPEDMRHSMEIIMKTTTIVWFVSTVISLTQFILNIGYRMAFSEFDRRQGFVDSRLFGIYSDPNFAAITSLVMIIFSVFLYIHGDRRGQRFFHGLNIVLQLLYVILSGSRTGMVEAVILAFVLTFLFVRNILLRRWDRHYKIKALAFSVLTTVITLVITQYSQGPLIKLASIGEELRADITGDDTVHEEITLNREDISEDDVTNNRLQIWKSSIKVSESKPIFGVSPRNLVSYATANYPDSYIAKTGYDTHNGYLAVYVGTGIAGTIVMLCFIIYMLYNVFSFFIAKKEKPWDDYGIVCLCTVLTIGISALMLMDIFFVNTFSAAIFWLLAGYFLYIARESRLCQ